ncbi:hypothetical protein [Actinomadura sp. WMMB 499]|uniref:hypothetical protein n=1 Tax=Actinomadura sp. WMMB 499 TaxID=1219491 RepID=UPI00124411AC|nr:hypothetical protein [Actinomadura sp. WMMB 499]QFG22500.1 hypothetical protein F7P10_16580 [Actinomadura sp. WMMB 499]
MTLVDYELQSEFARCYQARGAAKALLIILREREVSFSEETRRRILGCSDLGQLERWTRRAMTATSIDEVFFKEDLVDMGLRDRVEVARIQGAASMLSELLSEVKGFSVSCDLRDYLYTRERLGQLQQWIPWAMASETVEEFDRHIGRGPSEDEMIRRAVGPVQEQSAQ